MDKRNSFLSTATQPLQLNQFLSFLSQNVHCDMVVCFLNSVFYQALLKGSTAQLDKWTLELLANITKIWQEL